MIRPLIYYNNPILRKKCLPIEKITEEIHQLAADMIETMDEKKGVGLAACQIGVLLRIFVIRPEEKTTKGEYILGSPEVFINPILSQPSEEKEGMEEGCLSLPGLHLEVIRPVSIHIKAMNLEGEKKSFITKGFKAREIMHENDHLNGKLFIDRLDKKKKREINPFLQEIKKKYTINL